MEKQQEKRRIEHVVEKSLQELDSGDIDEASREGTLGAYLHGFYNQVGMKEGWLKEEYATPLSEQDEVNKRKNIDAAKDVVKYWSQQLEGRGEDVIEEMKRCVNYEANRGYGPLEKAADAQHEQWKNFVEEHQPERITPGHEEFREKNYEQFKKRYHDLSEQEKDQDRLVVAVITDRILTEADIGYEAKIEVEE